MKSICNVLFILTLAAVAHPDPSHTLAELDKHLADSPADPELLRRKAELLLRTGHRELALPLAMQARELAPADPAVLLLHARLAEAAGKRAEAVERIEAITRLDPNFSAAWSLLAGFHHEAGRQDEAISAKLLQLDVDAHPGPGDFLTCAGWLRDRGDAEAAVAVLDRGIARFGGLNGLQRAAIAMECSLGRHPAALGRVDALVVKYRPSVSFSLLRASIFESAGRFREAAAACDSALALLPAGETAAEIARLHTEIRARHETNLRRSGSGVD